MELFQSACCFLTPPKIRLTNHQRLIRFQTVSASNADIRKRVQFGSAYKSLNGVSKSSNGGPILCVSDSNSKSNSNLSLSRRENTGVGINRNGGSEPFRGKSGSISFHGLTHQSVQEGQLVSSPFKEGTGSLFWMLGPAAIISSLVLPQFFIGNIIYAFVKEEVLAEIVASLSSDALFYIGLGTFLLVTDTVQKPYIEFSPKRWGLITGLKGYLSAAFFTMGFKVIAPLFAVFVAWPVLGLSAIASVAPFLAGCLAQLAFEKSLEKRMSSCWPLIPIIFEVYRLYQLTKAAHFIETIMYSMKGAPMSPNMVEKSGALFGLIATFQVLGLLCLWSLVTFLMRLFPSRPVAENY